MFTPQLYNYMGRLRVTLCARSQGTPQVDYMGGHTGVQHFCAYNPMTNETQSSGNPQGLQTRCIPTPGWVKHIFWLLSSISGNGAHRISNPNARRCKKHTNAWRRHSAATEASRKLHVTEPCSKERASS